MKRIIAISIIILILGIALITRLFMDPAPIDKLDSLTKGMTKSEVIELLGEPTKKYSLNEWQYNRPMVFGFVNIHWQDDGTYDGEYNYERF
jgi:SmpA/OmlA family protein